MEIIEEMISTYVHMRVSNKWEQEAQLLFSVLREKAVEIISNEKEREQYIKMLYEVERRLG